MSNREILEEHYKAQYSALCQWVRRFGVPKGDEEDVVQEAYARALQYLEAYDPAKSFDTWLQTILVNCCNTHTAELRLQGASRADFDEEEWPVEDKGIEIDHLEIERIHKKIEAKEEPVRSTLRLYFLYGYAPLDISYLVEGLSRVNIRVIIQRFKQEMRELVT